MSESVKQGQNSEKILKISENLQIFGILNFFLKIKKSAKKIKISNPLLAGNFRLIPVQQAIVM